MEKWLTVDEFNRIIERQGYYEISYDWQPTSFTIETATIRVYTYDQYVHQMRCK